MAPKQEYKPIIAFTLDFETGDLDCQTSAITQIAIHATRLDTFERIGSFVRYVKPYYRKEIKGGSTTKKKKVLKSKFEADEMPLMVYQEEALTYSDISMDLLEEQGCELTEVAADALKFMTEMAGKTGKSTKPFLIGQNIDFDKGFFQQMIEYAGLTKEFSQILRGRTDFYGNWQPETLDTIMLSQLALSHRPEITTYRLESVCEQLGIELDDAHDADADVAATTNVVAVLSGRMRNSDNNDNTIQITKAEKTRKHFKI